MNLFIVDLEDRPGALAKVLEAIARRDINITAFGGITGGGSGRIAVITSDEEGARRALTEAGYRAREIELVTTTLEHTPGTLAAASRRLAAAGINIEAALPTAMVGGNVTIAFATDQPARARTILSEPGGTASH
jgi:hypothetical protein